MTDGSGTEVYADRVVLPACAAADQVGGNEFGQIVVPQQSASVVGNPVDGFRVVLDDGRLIPLVTREAGRSATELSLTATQYEIRDLPRDRSLAARARWVAVPDPQSREEVRASVEDAFVFRASETGQELRPPQAGAVHSVLGYWTTAPAEPATVVMPTGTGKTDTMIAIAAASRPDLLLVVVPSDALRTQIVAKFETWGVLPSLGLLSSSARPLVVGQVKHRFTSVEDAVEFAGACNVIVATPNALEGDVLGASAALLDECTHLFVDEAHHVAAATWQLIRDSFHDKRVVQFTATPFREDGKHLGGRVIYAFPLREAQAQGYFSHINYISVPDLGAHDQAIAERAVQQLRADLADHRDHLLMARVARVGRADDILPIYRALAPDLNPVLIHSRSTVADRRAALAAMRDRRSRIIVCVNMLGEGFDLPELKVAAIHDPHKSIGVTLQFVGRFARTSADLGDASVVVGRPTRTFDPELRRLFAEDSDWNLIVRDLSEGAVASQQEVSDFEDAFGSLPDEISMRSLLPKMSTVVYRVPGTADWKPEAVLDVYSEDQLLTVPIAINLRDGVAWFVTEHRTEVRWGDIKTVEEVSYHLFVLYWDPNARLLYINSSNKDSVHEGLAQAVCGPGVDLIRGEPVYRVMGEARRLVPTNVGLLDTRDSARRFMMLAGANVSEGFPVPGELTKTQTNIFAFGFENGERVSIGAALKGRVWSYRIADNLKEWTDWCDEVGRKLLDDTINIDAVMQNFIRPEVLTERPPLVVLGLEWMWNIYATMSEELVGELDDESFPLVDLEFEVTSRGTSGPIEFRVTSPEWSEDYTLAIVGGSMVFNPAGREIRVSNRRTDRALSDFLNDNGLFIHLEQDASITPPAMLLKPPRNVPPYNRDALTPLTWAGIDLSVESQGAERRADSVQARMISHLEGLDAWDVILDDDGTGEVADIVAMRSDGARLLVHLTHCKWVSGGAPRAQVIDLYEVCGQAQKSTKWRRHAPDLFAYLQRRERLRVDRGAPTGFIRGDASTLYRLEDESLELQFTMTIAVAQPGLSQTNASTDQLALLASTALYVHETSAASFEVFCSS